MVIVKATYREIRQYLKDSWSMGWPMILMMFFQFAIGITDVYVAGYLGTRVMAAVGYVGQLYFTLLIMANGITVGTVSMVSQAYGAHSDEGVGNIASQSLLIGIVLSSVLTAFAQIFPGTIIRAAGMPAEIREIAEAFLRIFSLVLIPVYVMIITGGVLRSSGRVRVAVINSCIAASVNVVGDVVLAFGWGPIPALGYQGIAWASAFATTVGMVLNLSYMFSGSYRIRLAPLMPPMSRCMRNLIKLGLPSALQQIAWNAGTLVVYFLVGGLQHGEITALAAMTAGLRIEALIFLPIFAFNMASAVLTGNRIGARDVDGARSGAIVTAALSLSITLLPSLAVFVLAPWISTLLTDDSAVIAEMSRYLRINMIGMPFFAVGVALSGALQGAGDTLATMRIIFTGMWGVRIPLILFVTYVLGAHAAGVWWCLTTSLILMCGLLVLRFRGDYWTTASIDTQSNKLLWEACLGRARTSGARQNPVDKGAP
ncbi:MAG: MATE family efflux transporter [Desulfomonile tiedjei]|nr:MATE family efflux transporter [Desulfomonile tiedjei]